MLTFRKSRSEKRSEKSPQQLDRSTVSNSRTSNPRDESGAIAVANMPELQSHADSEMWPQSIQDRIAERAYFRWVEAGKPPGRDIDYWLTAEHEILAEIAVSSRVGRVPA